MCSKFVVKTKWLDVSTNTNGIGINQPENRQFIINKAQTTTLSGLKALVGTDGIEICVELATPITIPLTASQILTLLSTNNVWCDIGQITVDYWSHEVSA